MRLFTLMLGAKCCDSHEGMFIHECIIRYLIGLVDLHRHLPFNSIYIFFKKLAVLLYKAAEDGSYVDPDKVEDILGLSTFVATTAKSTAGTGPAPIPTAAPRKAPTGTGSAPMASGTTDASTPKNKSGQC